MGWACFEPKVTVDFAQNQDGFEIGHSNEFIENLVINAREQIASISFAAAQGFEIGAFNY